MHLRARCKLNYLVPIGERAIEAHYDGHLIQVTALAIPETPTWRCSVIVIWNEQTLGRAKLFLQHSHEFTTTNDAVRCGLEMATNWIIDGKPEHTY